LVHSVYTFISPQGRKYKKFKDIQDRHTKQLILHVQDKCLAPAHVVFVMLWNSFSVMFS